MNLIPIQFQDDYKKILDNINAYKNGVTADAMQSYGIAYKMNFGASIIDLRRVAERYEKNQEFSQLLWDKGWRETYIMSTLLDDTKTYTIELLRQRLESAPTYEILEQLAYNTAWQLPFLDTYFETVKESKEDMIQYFLLKSTTYQLMKKNISASAAWKRLSPFTINDNASLMNVLQNLLLRITADDNSLHQEVIDYCAKQKTERWDMLTQIIKDYGVL